VGVQLPLPAPLQSPHARYAETASALTLEATLIPRGWVAAHGHFVGGSKGEARAHERKLSKAKPRDTKGVVCRGLPWVFFGLGIP
jgi:hypothetical protein